MTNLSFDVPVRKIKDDKLSRNKFAFDIADIILNLSNENKDSIVLGLYGEWGSGKSTLINFIQEYIEEKTELPDQFFFKQLNIAYNTSFFINLFKRHSFSLKRLLEILAKIVIILLIWNFSFIRFLNSFTIINSLYSKTLSSFHISFHLLYLFYFIDIVLKLILTSYIIVLPISKIFSPLRFLLNPFKNVIDTYRNSSYKKAKISKPIIINFNPWNVSTQEQLLQQFFLQLSDKLGNSNNISSLKEISKLIDKYSEIMRDKISKGISSFVSNIADLDNSNDIYSVKRDLEEKLRAQDQTILIFIDDLDRLCYTEIYTTFQLIKSIANFPNVVYFVSIDKKIVTNALNNIHEGFGEDYLEKIIQVPFEIPLANYKKVQELLFKKLDEIIVSAPNIDKIWQEKYNDYWIEVYHSGFKNFFNNVRDVIRYTNTLKILFNARMQQEINPVDFIVITAIQIFTPDLYKFILENNNDFIGASSSYSRNDDAGNIFKGELDKIINKIELSNNKNIKRLLTIIFPRLKSIYNNTNYGSDWDSGWRKAGRICSSDNFNKFFMYDIPEDELSLTEMNEILALTNDQNLLEAALLELSQQNRIKTFLERLEDYTSKDIKEENIVNIISALFNIGDFFPKGDEGFYSFDTSIYIMRITYQLLSRFNDRNAKFEILKNAIAASEKSIYQAIETSEVTKQALEKHDRPKEAEDITLEQLNELNKLILNKLDIWINNDLNNQEDLTMAFQGKLSNHSNLSHILYFWKRNGDNEKLNHYIDQMTKTNNGLIKILIGLLSKTKSNAMGSYVVKTTYKISKSTLEEFFDINVLQKRLEEIEKSQDYQEYNDKEKQAVQAAKDAIEGKNQREF